MRARPHRCRLLFLLVLLAAPGAVDAASLTHGVTRTVLPNGLTVLVRESRHAPVAAVVTYVKAGYFDEPDEVAGMAHLFEHMFFKGSRQFPGPAAIATAVRRLGGQTNAGTIYDSTTYHIVVPREGLEAAMEIQADAIAHPLFDPEELKREAEVVIEESNRKYDNAPALALETMYALAFEKHRMRRWRIGSNEVLRGIRRDDLLQFFETLYRPENIVVAVAGDVTAARVVETARRTYGAIPRGAPKRDAGPSEPPQTALRYGRMEGDIQQAFVTTGFHTPGVNHPDNAAIDLIAAILADGRSARLYDALVRAGLAQDVNAFSQNAREVGILTVQVRADPARVPEAEARVFAEIERLKREPATPSELERARNQVATSLALRLEDALGQARTLAYYEAYGSYGDLDREMARLQKVGPEQIRAAARRYLKLSNASLHRYLPRGAALADPGDPAADLQGRIARLTVNDRQPPTPKLQPSIAARGPLHGGDRDTELRRFTLPNGARLLVQERHVAPTAAIVVGFAGGKVEETPEQAGITALMLETLTRGAGGRDAATIDRAIERLGTSLTGVTRDDYFALTCSLLSRNLGEILAILRDVIREPEFPTAEVRRARELQLAGLRTERDNANAYPITLLMRALFGDFPYAWPAEGREESVATLDAPALRAWRRRVLRPDAMTILVVGDVRTDRLRSAVAEAFGDWGLTPPASVLQGVFRGQKDRPMTISPPKNSAGRGAGGVGPAFSPGGEIAEQRARRQTAFALGFLTTPFGHDDHPVLDVIQSLTSGLAGRFGIELRSRQSLAYVTGTAQVSRAKSGFFFGYLAGQYDKEERAREAMRAEFARLASAPPTPEEIDTARSSLAGAAKIRLQSNAAQAGEMLRNLILAGDPHYTARYLERIAVVTPDDVQRVAARYFGERYAVGVLRGGQPASAVPPAGSGPPASRSPSR
jgi:zinc protease